MPSVPDLALGKEGFFLKKILCRVSQIWRSAKIFFKKKYFAECPWHGTRQRFNFFYNFFAECSCGCTRQRGNFLKKFKTFFAECLMVGTRQRHPLPSAMPRHSAKFFFVFGLQIFCAALLKHQELLVTIWGFFVAFCYI